MRVICPDCGYEENSTVKGKVEGYSKVYEIGVKCFQCGTWTHCFYVNDRLITMRQKMDKYAILAKEYPGNRLLQTRAKKAASAFTKAFEQFNATFPNKLKERSDEAIASVTTV